MAVKDIRIVNNEGKISHNGRVEFRQNGRWGTVCKKNIQDSAAKMMCITLGFKDGKIKNSPDDQQTGFCASYEGKNYCGPEKMPIHFMGFVCDNIPDLKDIFGCGKKGAESCTH